MIHIPRWQIFLMLALVLAGFFMAAPNLVEREATEEWPVWLPQQQVNLGIDLRGGSHHLVEVGVKSALDERLQSRADSLARELRASGIEHGPLRVEDGQVIFALRDPDRGGELSALVRGVSHDLRLQALNDGVVRIGFTEQALRDFRNGIMEQTAEILRRRLDPNGTRELSLQRSGERRIVLQVPGNHDPEEIQKKGAPEGKLTFHFLVEQITLGRDPVPGGAWLLPADEIGPDGAPRRRRSAG